MFLFPRIAILFLRVVALTFAFLGQNLGRQLMVIPIVEESFVHICFCVPKDQEKSAAIRAFLDYLEAWLRDHPEGREDQKNDDGENSGHAAE